MRRSILAIPFLSIWALAALADAPAKPDAAAYAVKLLRAQFPKFDWQAKTAISVDIDADGLDDTAVLGYTEDTAAVGVVFGQKGNAKPMVKYMDFMRGDPSAQRAMSGRSGTLKASKQDEGIKDGLGGLPEGYRVCDRCYEVEVVGDGDSDQIFIYWDTVAKSLNWWRY